MLSPTISSIESISFSQNESDNKPLKISLMKSPSFIRRFRRRNEDSTSEDQKDEQCNISRLNSTRKKNIRSYKTGDSERHRSKTWGGADENEEVNYEQQHNNIDVSYMNSKLRKINFNSDHKSKTQKKFRELISTVLKKNLDSCTYDASLSRQLCTHISQILETTFRSTLNRADIEYKIIALVYIGEIREDGMKQSFQYSFNGDSDFFVMDTFRKDNMFATGTVFATLLENSLEYVDENIFE